MIRAMTARSRLRLDPWGLDYEAPLGRLAAEPAEEVDWRVETADWRAPIRRSAPAPAALAFIDGRRRVEARLLDEDDDGGLFHAALGAIAVGAVLVDPAGGAARFGPLAVRRVAVGSAGRRLGAFSAGEFRYEGLAASDESGPEAPGLAIQNAMLQAEAELAVSLAQSGQLVVRDGPLRWHPIVDAPVVGYVKTQQRPYLAGEQQALVRRLPAGARTPMFRLGAPGSDRARLSWYLRLAPVPPGAHALAGIVRLEVREGAGGDPAALADALALGLPRYASHPAKDPRAPQNLVPVAALERELGRRMGDLALVERRIKAAIIRQEDTP